MDRERTLLKALPDICAELGVDMEDEKATTIANDIMEKLPKAEKFLNRSIQPLQRFCNLLLRRKDIKISLGIGYKSYTDHQSIRLELSWGEIYKYTETQWYIILRFKAAHECQHNKSTVSKWFMKAQESCVKTWLTKAEKDGVKLSSMRLQSIAHFVVNSIEDGRIERILIGENPGLRKGQMWYRWECYDSYTVTLAEDEKEDLTTILNMLLNLATLGVVGIGFEEAYASRPKVLEVVKNCNIFVEKGTSATRCAGIIGPCGEIAKLIYPWIVVATQMTEAEKFFEELAELMERMSGSEGDGPSSCVPEGAEEEVGDSSKMAAAPIKQLMEDVTESENSKASEATESDEKADSSSEEKGSKDKTDKGANADGPESSDGSCKTTDRDGGGEAEAVQDGEESDIKEGSLKDSLKSALRTSMRNAVTQLEADCEKAVFREMAATATPTKIRERKEEDVKDSSISREDLDDVCSGYRRDIERDIPFRIAPNTRYRRESYKNPVCSSIGRQLKRQVEQMFRTKSTETQREQTSGKLDVKSLSKLTYGSGNVFLRKGMPYIPDIACYILKDGSGSMGGNKNMHCCEALGGIEDGMKGLIPLRIVDFSEDFGTPCVRHTVIKDWNESRKDFNYSWTFFQNGGGAEGNNFDGFSIRVATRELLSRAEQHKLLIVMSDGEPWSSLCHYSHGADDVRSAVEEARKAGIYVVSIFFGDQSFIDVEKKIYEHMYQKNFFGATPENLVKELGRHLKKFIKAY